MTSATKISWNVHERDVFRRTDYRRAAYEDESSRERERERESVRRRRSDEEEEKDDDAEEERVADSRLSGGRGGSARKCERTFGRDASRGRIKCNDVTLLFFFFYFPYVSRVRCVIAKLHRLGGTYAADNRRRRKRRSKGKELCNNNTRLSARFSRVKFTYEKNERAPLRL